jgi:hypothetical protein
MNARGGGVISIIINKSNYCSFNKNNNNENILYLGATTIQLIEVQFH